MIHINSDSDISAGRTHPVPPPSLQEVDGDTAAKHPLLLAGGIQPIDMLRPLMAPRATLPLAAPSVSALAELRPGGGLDPGSMDPDMDAEDGPMLRGGSGGLGALLLHAAEHGGGGGTSGKGVGLSGNGRAGPGGGRVSFTSPQSLLLSTGSVRTPPAHCDDGDGAVTAGVMGGFPAVSFPQSCAASQAGGLQSRLLPVPAPLPLGQVLSQVLMQLPQEQQQQLLYAAGSAAAGSLGVAPSLAAGNMSAAIGGGNGAATATAIVAAATAAALASHSSLGTLEPPMLTGRGICGGSRRSPTHGQQQQRHRGVTADVAGSVMGHGLAAPAASVMGTLPHSGGSSPVHHGAQPFEGSDPSTASCGVSNGGGAAAAAAADQLHASASFHGLPWLLPEDHGGDGLAGCGAAAPAAASSAGNSYIEENNGPAAIGDNGPAVGELVEADDLEAEVDSAEPQVSGASNTLPGAETSTAQQAVEQSRSSSLGAKRRSLRR